MGEPGTATACAAASSQEALGYENRGREAKRRETAERWKRKRCGGIHPRMGKESGNTGNCEKE